ncbi:hypothetical protein B9H00_16110 [Kushneria marisflavi]|uniref:Uncharacterized protein n=1 Tax=Kushneria marisflavi TaxID=157779 RepID=A0A240UTQ4_9GAMM|nr:hypothetical protein B9H00_16110 [Kushneria marisflavi]
MYREGVCTDIHIIEYMTHEFFMVAQECNIFRAEDYEAHKFLSMIGNGFTAFAIKFFCVQSAL